MTYKHPLTAKPILLETKISVPILQPNRIHRPRLTELIDLGVLGPLTLIVAPTGFGKTHLLIEWINETNYPVAWLSLDPDDNDLYRFISYMIGALQTIEHHLGQETLELLPLIKANVCEIGMTLLINEIIELPNEIILVFDDFQVINNEKITQCLEFFIKNLPQNIRIIISSRREPSLDLPGLRSKGKVFDLSQNDLRFIGDEVEQFLTKSLRMQLPQETIKSLERKTEGWIAALQMVALSLRNKSDPEKLIANITGNTRYIVDYLAREVLQQQDQEIQEFLLKSSILENLTGSLCEAVVRPDAHPGYGMVMLHQLERANLFITALDQKHDWYRYHQLFSEFLRHIQTETNPAETASLYKRAALWYEKQNNLTESFHYAHASGDLNWMADLIERNIKPVIASGEILPLAYWINMLPDEIIGQRPGLCLSNAWVLIASYQIDLARYWIDYLKTTYDLNTDQVFSETRPDAKHLTIENQELDFWNIQGGMELCQSSLAILTGNLEKAEIHSKQATKYLRKDNPFIKSLLSLDESMHTILSGNTIKAVESLQKTINIARQANNLYVLIYGTFRLARIQALQGLLDQAWATLKKAQVMATAPDGKPLLLASLLNILFGEILYERNLLDEASHQLEYVYKNTQHSQSLERLYGLLIIARLRQAQGDLAGAKEIINESYKIALGTSESQWDDFLVSCAAVKLALQHGDLDTAGLWWKKGGFSKPTDPFSAQDYPYHIYEHLLLTQARYLLELGAEIEDADMLDQCLQILNMLLYEAERFERLTSKIEILVLLSRTQLALQDQNNAIQTLLNALALGEPEGYQRIYLDEGENLIKLLIHSQKAPETSRLRLPSPAFITNLIETCQSEGNKQKDNPRTGQQQIIATSKETRELQPVTLSNREVDVLKLIAEGKTNREISNQLHIALNTVKRHAYNIYQKLEVKNRTQAVTKARKLDLIP